MTSDFQLTLLSYSQPRLKIFSAIFFILFGAEDSYKIPITKGKECIMPKFSIHHNPIM
jgi:hypothetical protein